MKFAYAFFLIFTSIILFAQNELSPELDPAATAPQNRDLYDLQWQAPVGVGGGEAGIECDNNFIYTTKWNGDSFYRYELDGTYIEEFTITGASNIRDLAYDGEFFYGGAATPTVYILDLTNETLIDTFTAPTDVRAIAYDPTADGGNGGFWTNNWNTDITLFSMDGTFLDSFPVGTMGSYYGFAWEDVSDPGVPTLWGYSQDGSGNELVKFDIASGIQLSTYDIAQSGVNYNLGDLAGGLAITDQLVYGTISFLGIIQNESLWALELGWWPNWNPPGSPTDVAVIPDAGGNLEAQIDWICPNITVYGDPLTELLEMRVYRNDELIYTDSNPSIGGPGSCTDDTVPTPGNYTYKIAGYNSDGEGIPVSITSWVGEDVPAAVEDLVLDNYPPNSAILTWTNPTTGLHGGAFNEPILGYHIVRSDSAYFEIAGIQTQWIDDTIPAPGYYSYTVQPYNSVGDGGIAETTFLPWPVFLIYEEFYGGVFPPDGWSTEGENWGLSNSNNAGGTIPEACFSWTPSTVGTKRLISYPIDTSDMSYLRLQFYHFIDPHTAPNYDLMVQTTGDGQNWNTVAEIEYIENTIVYEDIIWHGPNIGSENMQIAWVFSGDPYTINYWYIDNVNLIEFYLGSTGIVEGNVTLSGGIGNVEDVEVFSNNLSVNPDVNGDYSIILPTGSWDLTAFLYHFDPVTIEDILVEENVTISGIDFTLSYVPLTPPSNLAVNDMGIFSWDAPQSNGDERKSSRDLHGYDVYLDDIFLGHTEQTQWQFENLINGQIYTAGVEAVYDAGNSQMVTITFPPYVDADDIQETGKIELLSNFPNPFNPSTTITFSLTAKDAKDAKIEIFNLKGQRVKTLECLRQLPDAKATKSLSHSVIWNGTDSNGKPVPSGVYFYRLMADDKPVADRKMLFLK